MRKLKRDPSERAYKRGYMAGVNGKSKSQCPADSPAVKQEWLNGWRDGRQDNWDGYVGISGVHKLPGITA